MSKSPGDKLSDDEPGLDCFSQSDGVCKEQSDPAASDRSKNRNKLVGLKPKTSRLDCKESSRAQGLFEEEGLVIDQPIRQRSRSVGAELMTNRFDVLERIEKVEFLPKNRVFKAAKAKEGL